MNIQKKYFNFYELLLIYKLVSIYRNIRFFLNKIIQLIDTNLQPINYLELELILLFFFSTKKPGSDLRPFFQNISVTFEKHIVQILYFKLEYTGLHIETWS